MTFEQMWTDIAPVGRSSSSQGYFRQPYGSAEMEMRAWFTEECTRRGLELEADGNGNLVAWWGHGEDAVLTGSHLDSVLDGGAYDGPLGVASSLAAVDVLRDRGFTPRRPIAIGVFADEEGSRFGIGCLGSQLATGLLTAEDARLMRDRDGLLLEDVMASAGLEPSLGRSAWLDRVGCYVELHVEQGRNLVDRDAAVGVASGIWPHGRWRFDFDGEANHAGATRMEDRRDPMLTFAMTALAADEEARRTGQRATFGRIQATPNGTNAVPSRVAAWLDARCENDAMLADLVATLTKRAGERAAALVVAGGPRRLGRPRLAEHAGRRRRAVVDAGGRAVIPGFVDSHSHLVFAGDRRQEFAARMAGRAVRRRRHPHHGRATRAATDEQLTAHVARLVAEMRRQGTTTVEIKSGYGLTVRDEARSLAVARQFTDETTFLGAHVVPTGPTPEEYVALVTGPMLEAAAPHARWIDVFCERAPSTPTRPARSSRPAPRVGLRGRLHANQLTYGPGVQLAASSGWSPSTTAPTSSDADVDALRDSGTVATLLPGVEFSTRQPYPDARRLLDAGRPGGARQRLQPGLLLHQLAAALHRARRARDGDDPGRGGVHAATYGGAAALRGAATTSGEAGARARADRRSSRRRAWGRARAVRRARTTRPSRRVRRTRSRRGSPQARTASRCGGTTTRDRGGSRSARAGRCRSLRRARRSRGTGHAAGAGRTARAATR
jgi:N-carbamoyl-L-amino-acid hydrolase